MNKNILFLSFFSLSIFLESTPQSTASDLSEPSLSSSVLDSENQGITQFTVESFFEEEALEAKGKHDALMEIVAGKKAQNSGSNLVKKHFYKAARLGDPRGMIELARVYYTEGALEESMRWATLAYNTDHIQTSKPYEEAMKFFAEALKDLAAEKKENFRKKYRFLDSKQKKKVIYGFLSSKLFTEKIHSSHILWRLTFEPFYNENLSKNKRIYLLGLTKHSSENMISHLMRSSHAVDLEKLMQVAREVALSKGEEEQEGLILLGTLLQEKEDASFFRVWKEANTEETLFRCGLHLEYKARDLEMTNVKRTALLKEAIALYERSGGSMANERIGTLYMIDLCGEPEAYKKAFQALTKSGSSASLLNLAELIRFGYHGEKADVGKAKDVLLSLQEKLESDLESEDSKKILPDLYNNLGSIFQGLGQLNVAIEYYKKSKTEFALNSLSDLLPDQDRCGEGLSSLLKNNKSITSKLNAQHCLYDNGKINKDDYLKYLRELLLCKIRPEELGYIIVAICALTATDSQLYQESKEKFLAVSHLVAETEKLIILSKIDILEKNYDRARLYLSKLVLGASAEGITLLDQLDQLELEEAIQEENLALFRKVIGFLQDVTSKRAEASSEEESDDDEEEDKKKESEDKEEPFESLVASTSLVKPSLPKLSKSEKRAIKESKKQMKAQRKKEKRLADWGGD